MVQGGGGLESTDLNVEIKDGNGNTATIIATDIEASNGMVHLIDGVVMKKAS